MSLTDENILIKFSGHYLLTTSCIRFTIDWQYIRMSGRTLDLTNNEMALSLLSLKNINLRARFCNIGNKIFGYKPRIFLLPEGFFQQGVNISMNFKT